jgi:hypothetical protein
MTPFFYKSEMIRPSFKLRIGVMLSVVFLFSIRVHGQDIMLHPLYCAKGVIKYQSIDKNGHIFFEALKPFSIMEDDSGKWKMELNNSSAISGSSIHSKEIISYDGKDIYSILKSDSILVSEPSSQSVKVVAKNSSFGDPAKASIGPYPVDYGNSVGILWLAFCGGKYLDPQKSDVKWPNLTVANARTDPLAWISDFKYQLIQNATHPLIRSGQYSANSVDLKLDPTNYTEEMDEPATPDDYSRFEYQVNEYASQIKNFHVLSQCELDQETNFGGIDIPLQFHCDINSLSTPSYNAHFEVIVTNITQCSNQPLLPEITAITTVEDRRMRSKPIGQKQWRREVYYTLRQNHWITDTNDMIINAAVAKQQYLFRLQPSSANYKHRATLVLCLLFTLTIVPILLLLWNKMKLIRNGKSR